MVAETAHMDVKVQSDGSMAAVLKIEEGVGKTLRRTETYWLVFIMFQQETLIAGIYEAVDLDWKRLIFESAAVET